MPKGWIASGGAGAVGVVLGSWLLFIPAASAQVAGAAAGHPKAGVEWAGFAKNAQHTATATAKPQPFDRIRWRVKVDLHPVITLRDLLIHYGSPMITAANTVLVPTRISTKAGFRVVAYSGNTGAKRWSLATDYRTPAFIKKFDFKPPLPAALTPSGTLAVAGAGGTILLRDHSNLKTGTVQRRAFYGLAQWRAHQAAYAKAVQVTTPLTVGPGGAGYFGFTVTGSTPDHLASGIARIAADGKATWISASAAAGSRSVTGVAINCAPALSPNGRILYIAVTSPTSGTLVGLNATTLKPRSLGALKDPSNGLPAVISPSSSASPTVGPDG